MKNKTIWKFLLEVVHSIASNNNSKNIAPKNDKKSILLLENAKLKFKDWEQILALSLGDSFFTR